MPTSLESLQTAIADRYRIERELGRGAAAIVLLATDLRHGRKVALKVLRPELATVVGAARFLQEVRVTAHLQHPHILSLHDSGQTGEFVFYTMPYVEGETLRARLRREKQLPVEDAVRVAREVASALDHAHRQGIIHRDIKPENILLDDSGAFVADFGIALALEEAGGDRLTESGMSLGTPHYMSPEQWAGPTHLDGRTDIYSLGAVLYEMLAGEPPHPGATMQAIFARAVTTAAAPLRSIRETVPPAVERAVAKALARAPVDRFATAAEFARALESPPSGFGLRVPTLRKAGLRWIAALGLLLAGAAWLSLLRGRHPNPPALDPNLVVVVPFHVSGADPALAYLGEGMVDLLAAILTGEGGPRSADPRSVMSAANRATPLGSELTEPEALQVARRLGAGRVLLGTLVGTARRMVISGRLLEVGVGGGSIPAQATGPTDSLPALVDRFASQLLAREAGGVRDRLGTLSGTSVSALKPYLDGQAAYRRGRYVEATGHFQRALAADSTFALAALGLATAAFWPGPPELFRAGVTTAWQRRDRLSARDRALLAVWRGPRYPAAVSTRDHLAELERALEAAPDRPDAWYLAGDILFHHGAELEVENPWRTAQARFQKALELDPAFAGPLVHLAELDLALGKIDSARRFQQWLRSTGSGGDVAGFLDWYLAARTGDRQTLARLRPAIGRLPTVGLESLVTFAQLDGVELEDAERAAAALLERAGTEAEQSIAAGMAHTLALNRGRPRSALRLGPLAGPEGGCERCLGMSYYARLTNVSAAHRARWLTVRDALWWDGDSAAAAQAVREMAEASTKRGLPRGDADWGDLCHVELWRLAHDDLRSASSSVAAFAGRSPAASVETETMLELCQPLLAALLARAERSSTASQALARLDSTWRNLPRFSSELLNDGLAEDFCAAANLVIARLRELDGDLGAARSALRRRPWEPGPGPLLLSTYLREAGRLAAKAGDRTGAVAAYRQYLQLRTAPEPELAADRDRIRAELSRLTTASR